MKSPDLPQFAQMDPIVFSAYAGVYQAYAWHQGYEGIPVTFRIPMEYFYVAPGAEEGFDLPTFFRVVETIDDEGLIHSWKFYEEKGDRFLVLACTEDDSMSHPSYNEDEFGHASWHLEKEEA